MRSRAIGAAVVALPLVALVVLAAMARTATDAWGRAYVVDCPERLLRSTRPSCSGPRRSACAERISGHCRGASTRPPACGVPAVAIELDPNGDRTWDSIARARYVFGRRRLVIVSQRDHLARALFLARHVGIDAWGVAARGVIYGGLYGTLVDDVASLRAYVDLIEQPFRQAIAAGPPR